MIGSDCPSRVVIESVQPEIDHGEFPIKRTAGGKVVVEADVFADGHDQLCASVLHRRRDDRQWNEVPMQPLDRELELIVDRPRAGCSAWYEMFPRSAASTPGKHGTLADVEARLPYVAAMGFDVLYLAPIHPVGQTHRKGRNNAAEAQPADVGSPWGIDLQTGGRPAFMARLVLAATMSPNYGIYGPPFEHCWSKPREPGSEEYLWHGARNYVELNPQQGPAHIFRIQRRVRREQDFEYYM